MNDEPKSERKQAHQPVLVGPQPFSFDKLLTHLDPVPDDETERFVAAIYADRRQAAESSPRE